MPSDDENIIWQYWETSGEKPRFIDGLHEIAKRNSGVKVNLITPETLKSYLPTLEDEVHRISDPSHKADMIRTRLVMHHGGMWLDSDAVVLSDLNWLFEYLKDYEFVAFNNAGQLQTERPWMRVNCFLSRPNGKIVGEWVRLQRAKFPKVTFNWSEIGAEMLNRICLDNEPLVKIMPFEKICPVPWDKIETFTSVDDDQAERILKECFMVMLTNRALKNRLPQLQRLTIEELASREDLLGKIMRSAIAFARVDSNGRKAATERSRDVR
jgi:hypothetical protein